MRRTLAFVLCALALLALDPGQAKATFTNYAFAVTTGSVMTPSSWTSIVAGASGTRTRSGYYNTVFGFNLPFTFVLDGVSYSRASVSTNGLMSLGNGNASTTGSNDLNSTSSTYGQFPRIAAWWDQLYVTGGAPRYCGTCAPEIRWGTVGTAPNRVVVVDFRDMEVASRTAAFSSWQVRFFESSNVIEFFYTNMSSYSPRYGSYRSTFATIGIADASNDFISVTPNYSSATTSYSSDYNSVNLSNSSHRMPANTVYRFAPCNISLAGNVAQGGTAGMYNGDTLMSGISEQRGNSQPYTPFTISNSTSGCGTRTYSMSISGPHAADYTLNTYSGSIGSGGTVTPTLTFTPRAIGVREATLNVFDNNGFVRSYPLAATGLTRIAWISDLAEGGSPTLADGDTLLQNIAVRRLSSDVLTPITIANTNLNPSAVPATVVVSIDSAGGASTQYQLLTPSVVPLAAGETFTPEIQFSPLGFGPQEARLVVSADGEIRTYTLRAIALAPAIAVAAAGVAADAENPVFNQHITCVGDVVTSIPFEISNVGTLPLVVSDIDVFLIDTTYQQGTPALPLVRDALGNPVPVTDYVISDVPGSVPVTSIPPVSTPFSVAPGSVRVMYLTFIGQEPGKRFARIFVRTNAENIAAQDTSSTPTEGLFTTDVVARAVGSRLAFNESSVSLRPIVFPHTRVGDTAVASFAIVNNGACDLRINRNRFRVSSGDVHEFKLIAGLVNAGFDATTGDYLLPSGVVDTVRVRFTPSRSGTRMATLVIQTNDSTIVNPGVTERGAYYLDLSGRGLAGLDGHDIVLDPVAIGTSVTGTAVLENSLNFPVAIAEIGFIGGEAAQFSADPAKPWPAYPHTVLPGQKVSLSVRMTPVGDPGLRSTTMYVLTTFGDTTFLSVRGEAGTQALVVSPASMFDNVTIGIGQSVRETVIISNAGTLPTRLASITITGADSASYRLGMIPRLDLEAGQTEFIEVTYAPITPGQTSATLEVKAADGVVHSVMLGGTAVKIRLDPIDDVTTTAPDHGTLDAIDEPQSLPTLR